MSSDRYALVVACGGNSPDAPSNILCAAAINACPDGQTLYWTYRSADDDNAVWTPTGAQCLGAAQAAAAAAFPGFTLADFRRLPLPAARVQLSPDNGYALINTPTGLHADAQQVVIPTQVIGTPVQVRATPATYTWDFGDGDVLGPTDDPGGTWPDLHLTHTWTAGGDHTITLTTAYTGEYAVAGGPWLPIDGTAEVASPAAPLAVLVGHGALVADTTG